MRRLLACAVAAAWTLTAGAAEPTTANPPAAPAAAPRPAGASAALLDWIQVCIPYLASDDERVRAGATLALRSAGDAARPALEQAAANTNPTLSAGAKRVIEQLDGADRPPRPGEPRRPGQRPPRSAARVVDLLGLEGERATAVGEVLDDYDKRHQELVAKLQSGQADRASIVEQIGELRREVDERMASILDEEQMKRYRQVVQPPPPPVPATPPASGD